MTKNNNMHLMHSVRPVQWSVLQFVTLPCPWGHSSVWPCEGRTPWHKGLALFQSGSNFWWEKHWLKGEKSNSQGKSWWHIHSLKNCVKMICCPSEKNLTVQITEVTQQHDLTCPLAHLSLKNTNTRCQWCHSHWHGHHTVTCCTLVTAVCLVQRWAMIG